MNKKYYWLDWIPTTTSGHWLNGLTELKFAISLIRQPKTSKFDHCPSNQLLQATYFSHIKISAWPWPSPNWSQISYSLYRAVSLLSQGWGWGFNAKTVKLDYISQLELTLAIYTWHSPVPGKIILWDCPFFRLSLMAFNFHRNGISSKFQKPVFIDTMSPSENSSFSFLA